MSVAIAVGYKLVAFRLIPKLCWLLVIFEDCEHEITVTKMVEKCNDT